MSARGLPGRRVEENRAGMTATAVAGDRVTDPALCSTGNSSTRRARCGLRRLGRQPSDGFRATAEGRMPKAAYYRSDVQARAGGGPAGVDGRRLVLGAAAARPSSSCRAGRCRLWSPARPLAGRARGAPRRSRRRGGVAADARRRTQSVREWRCLVATAERLPRRRDERRRRRSPRRQPRLPCPCGRVST